MISDAQIINQNGIIPCSVLSSVEMSEPMSEAHIIRLTNPVAAHIIWRNLMDIFSSAGLDYMEVWNGQR